MFAPGEFHIVVSALRGIEVGDGHSCSRHFEVESRCLAAADGDGFGYRLVAWDGGGDAITAFGDGAERVVSVFGGHLEVVIQLVDADHDAAVVVVANEVDGASQCAHVVGEALDGETERRRISHGSPIYIRS